jgi:hypothetical protein
MKALSIKDPWSYHICAGIKDVENRTWKTNYRGRIYVHVPAKSDIMYYLPNPYVYENMLPSNRILSAIIGEVDIWDCVMDDDSIWAQSNHWHWLLKDAVLYDKPILNVKGKLRLWEYKR